MTSVLRPIQESPRFSSSQIAFLGLIFLAAFGPCLVIWFSFVAKSEIYSYATLIPALSLYFLWLRRKTWPPTDVYVYGFVIAVIFSALATSTSFFIFKNVAPVSAQNAAFFSAALFLASLFAIGLAVFRIRGVRQIGFPAAYLLLMVPLPVGAEKLIDRGLQHGSAWVGEGLFASVGAPVYCQELRFQLPGITLEVAPECSGIHSSLALLVVSLLAGYLLLTTPWRRIVLALAVIPLALLRNGFRIFVIGELCIQRGPQMIESDLHRHGGPLFFAASLIPFSALLWLLVRTERRVLLAPIR